MEDIVAITNLLSGTELKSIRKILKGDKQKLKLIDLLTDQKISSIDTLIEKLNYQKNKNAFYTIKHRLLQDIIHFKFSQGKNQVIKTKEEISNLRTLLYSNQPKLLEKKLHDLLKRSDEIELYNGKREIYLCMFILNYHDKKKRKEIKPLLAESQKKEHAFYRMESIFFSIIFKSQDLFYSRNKKKEMQIEHGLKKMKQLNDILDSKISDFLYKSSLLTVQLNTGVVPDFNEISGLYVSYVSSPLQFYYPNCKLAIKCLYCKYYYHTENWEKFRHAIEELQNDIDEIKGYRTYEDIYYFYLFSVTFLYLKTKKYDKLHGFISDEITDKIISISSNKMIYSLIFLRGVAQFYQQNYKKAAVQFLKAQNYRKWLNDENKWVDMENSMFLLLCYFIEENDQLLEHEIQYLKRKAKSSGEYHEILNTIMELILKRKKSKTAASRKVSRDQKTSNESNWLPKLLNMEYLDEKVYPAVAQITGR